MSKATPARLIGSVLCLVALGLLLPGVLPYARAQTPAPTPPTPPDRDPPIPNLPGARFERITTEDGLSQNTVTAILQDNRGFLWFGTEAGLNKYDGYSFTIYRHDPADPGSLRDDSITSLYEDPDGTLWVGTQVGWLERLDRQTGRFSHAQFDSAVLAVYEDREGIFWVLTSSTAYQVDRQTGESTVILTETCYFTSILEDRDGVLWLSERCGFLHAFDRELGRFRPVPLTVPLQPYRGVLAVDEATGELWLGREGGGVARLGGAKMLDRYVHDPKNPNSLVDDAVISLCVDHTGRIWIGTRGSGLDRLDPGTGRVEHFKSVPGDVRSLSDDVVLSLYEDRSGVLWAGTLSGGLSKLDLAGSRIYHYRHVPGDDNSLANNLVFAIHQDRAGVWWVGTGTGLDLYDPAQGTWSHIYNDPNNPGSLQSGPAWCVFEDSDGTMWIGTEYALVSYNRARDEFAHYTLPGTSGGAPEAIRSIDEGADGRLWLGGSRGLYRMDRTTGVIVRTIQSALPLSWFPLGTGLGKWRVSVLADRSGSVWYGTPGDGLYRLDGRRLSHYQADDQDPASLSSNLVSYLYQDGAGRLWVGTGGGLDRYDPATDKFVHMRVQDGLPSNEIRAIIEDDVPTEQGGPHLWISTVDGLARLDPDSGAIRTFNLADGLQSAEFYAGSVYKSGSGALFFGGINGFNAFYPDQLAQSSYVPPVIVTSLRVFDHPARTDLISGERVELAYRQNTLSFEFSALAYNDPARNQYAFRMDGIDADWVAAGTRRYAEYRDLRPGKYVFHVKASNKDGVWNEEGATVEVAIRPPFWQTGWFRLALGLAGLAVGLGLVRLRVRGIAARNRELEAQVEQRTAELRQETEQRLQAEAALQQSERERAVVAERNRLARELHDSVTQSAFAVTLYADAAWKRLSTGQVEPAMDDVVKLRRTAKQALGEMRQIVFALRPPILKEEGLVAALQARLQSVERRVGLNVDFRAECPSRPPMEVEEALYGIAIEALNNVIRHAQAQSVTVKLEVACGLHEEARSAVLEIADDGVGLDPDAASHGGMGLRGMAERAEEIGARFGLQTQPGAGTRVTVEWRADE